jgi:transcriptional regulator with XRE-family HTH domain
MFPIRNMSLVAIGEQIRSARKAKNLTQAELASALRMGRSTVSQLENGIISELGIRRLSQICDRLGLELIARPRNAALTLEAAYRQKKAERDEAFREADTIIREANRRTP